MSQLFEKIPMEGVKLLLGRIPLVAEVGEAAEQGKSIFSQANKQVAGIFEEIAERIISRVEGVP
jgi:hypothetical protein